MLASEYVLEVATQRDPHKVGQLLPVDVQAQTEGRAINIWDFAFCKAIEGELQVCTVVTFCGSLDPACEEHVSKLVESLMEISQKQVVRVRLGLKSTQVHELQMTAMICEPDAQGARHLFQLDRSELYLYSQAVPQGHHLLVSGG